MHGSGVSLTVRRSQKSAVERDLADVDFVDKALGWAVGPANTLVQARLVGDEYLVEIEAEAEVGSGEGSD